MWKVEVLAAYGGVATRVCRALDSSPSSGMVSKWKDLIPEKPALKLGRIKGNGLTYDPSLYKKEIKK